MIVKKKLNKTIDLAILEKGKRGAKENYILQAYYDKKTIFTFLHVDDNKTVVDEESKFLSSFSFGTKTDYINYKKIITDVFKKLFQDKKIFEYKDFLKELNDNISKIKSEEAWVNEYYLPSEKKQNNNFQNNKNKKSSKKQKVNQIKPVVLLETLEKMGLIVVENITPNTTGEDFWKYTIKNNYGTTNYNFKTSVKNKNFIINNAGNFVCNIFNDVYNTSRGYGSGSIGLINYLGCHGLFEDSLLGKENDEKRYFRNLNFLHDEVLPNVPKELLITELDKKDEVINLDNYSRLPIKKKGKEDLIKNFLLFRGFSEETISNLIKREKVYSGFFSQNSFEKGHKIHFNQIFVDLQNSEDETVGSERFIIFQNQDGSYKSSKFNTAKVSGNAFKINGKNPKMTIFTEAVIDALSQYELIKESGLPVSNYNIFSVQGCGHLNNWFQHNLGFGFELNERFHDEYGKVFSVSKKEEFKTLSPLKKEKYKKSLEQYDFYYVSLNEDADQINLEKIKEFENLLNKKVTIINKEYRAQYIDYNQYDSKKSVFIDATNFDNFFKVNNLNFSYDDYDKEYALKEYFFKFEKEKLTSQKIEEIKNIIQEKLGTDTMAIAFDNDDAGRKYSVVVDYLREELGIKAINSIPENIKTDTDLNDVLKEYKKEINNNSEKALNLLQNHINKVEPDFEIKKKLTNNINNNMKKPRHA